MGARIARPLMVVTVCFAVVVSVAMTWRAPSAFTGIGYADTTTGPIGPADKDMLARVKQAGLWEMPVGSELKEKATSRKLREVGSNISKEHHKLNEIVDKVAKQLDVELPSQATAEQRAWVEELSAMPEGEEYDRQAVRRLREAHGVVLPLLAQIFVSTRNDVVRDTANEGMKYVNRHIDYLESTGLVNHSLLPEPPQPKPALSPVKGAYYELADRPTMMFGWLVIVLCMLGSIWVVSTMVRGKKR